MPQAVLKGARLAFVVQPIEGVVKREKMRRTKQGTWEKYMVEEPAGFMVYFPRGHAVRIKNERMLRHYGLDKKPRIIEMRGLENPNTPLGKLFLSQDKDEREKAWEELETQVIRLSEVKAGPQTVLYNPNDPNDRPKSGQVAA